MLILPGHLWLTWFIRALGTLSPAGDVMTRDSWVPPPLWGSLFKREPFGVLVLQECKSFGSTSSSMVSLSSQGWSNTVRLGQFLHLGATWWTERVNKGCDCAAPLTILPYSPTLSGGHLSYAWASRERRWVLCILLCMSCQVGETHLTALTGLFGCISFLSPNTQPLHHPPRPRCSGGEYEKGGIHFSSRQSLLSLYMPSACCHQLHL